MFDAEVRARAISAAVRAVRYIGGTGADPVVLHDAHRLSVLLPDHSTVARVVPATAAACAAAQRELDVTRHLHERGAPVVAPAPEMSSAPIVEDGLAVTLWPHILHRRVRSTSEVADAARALARVHDALADYPGALPSLAEKIDECVALLRQTAALPTLSAADRGFLMRVHERLHAVLAVLPVHVSPIHGDAHIGNVFVTPTGPLWTDFEAACLGPPEWDAVAFDHVSPFGGLDPETCATLSELRSLCVTVWCSVPGAGPDERAAAAWHLARLRRDEANQQ